MYRNHILTAQTLTDAGVLTFDPSDKIESIFEGLVHFVVKGDQLTGTLSGNCQLQGSLDGINFVNIGSPVAIVDGVSVAVPLGSATLIYTNYRVELTGAGTQSSTINAHYGAKGRSTI